LWQTLRGYRRIRKVRPTKQPSSGQLPLFNSLGEFRQVTAISSSMALE
jgi:hypothetical protein